MHRKFTHRLASALAPAAAIALFFHPLPCARAQDVLDGVAGVVNSDVITYSQIRDLTAEKQQALRHELKGQELVNKIQEIRLAAFDELVDRALTLQEFKKKGFTIPEDLVDQRITAIIDEKFGGDRAAFLRDLQRKGYTLDRFKELERDKLSVNQMRRQVIAGKIHISEDQISDYYRQFDASGKSLKERRDDIEKTLIENESRRLQEEWIKELRKGAYIKNYGIKDYAPFEVLD